MSAKDQIIALIPKLKPSEVADVRAALKIVETLSSAAKEPDLITDWLLSGFITYLSRKGLLTSSGAVWELKRRQAYKTYVSKLPEVMRYLVRLERGISTTTRHRQQLSFLCARALAELLESWGVFSVGAMLTQVDKIPEALAFAYPGYAQAGMIGFLLLQVESDE